MNPETAKVDVQSLPPGGVVIYEESLDRSLNLAQVREDVFTYPVPFDKITAASVPKSSCVSWSETWCTWALSPSCWPSILTW